MLILTPFCPLLSIRPGGRSCGGRAAIPTVCTVALLNNSYYGYSIKLWKHM